MVTCASPVLLGIPDPNTAIGLPLLHLGMPSSRPWLVALSSHALSSQGPRSSLGNRLSGGVHGTKGAAELVFLVFRERRLENARFKWFDLRQNLVWC